MMMIPIKNVGSEDGTRSKQQLSWYCEQKSSKSKALPYDDAG
jgi:hypothetical protein